MKGIILYKSKYGSMKKYAEWISEETGFPCIETDKAQVEQLADCDVVLLGGGIYSAGISGIYFLKRHIDELKGKKIIVFCGGASDYDEETLKHIARLNFRDKLEGIPYFYCRGAWDYQTMNDIDKFLCRTLLDAVSRKDPEGYEPWEKALVEAGLERRDWTDKKYIQPIIEAVNS